MDVGRSGATDEVHPNPLIGTVGIGDDGNNVDVRKKGKHSYTLRMRKACGKKNVRLGLRTHSESSLGVTTLVVISLKPP